MVETVIKLVRVVRRYGDFMVIWRELLGKRGRYGQAAVGRFCASWKTITVVDPGTTSNIAARKRGIEMRGAYYRTSRRGSSAVMMFARIMWPLELVGETIAMAINYAVVATDRSPMLRDSLLVVIV